MARHGEAGRGRAGPGHAWLEQGEERGMARRGVAGLGQSKARTKGAKARNQTGERQ
jgi:hypothetical protein